jgi:heme A synthase
LIVVIIIFILLTGIFPLTIYLVRVMQRKDPYADDARTPLDAAMTKEIKGDPARLWWENKRSRYNKHLFLAGIFAIALYYSLIFAEIGSYQLYQFTFSVWHFIFVVILYLIYMGIANLVYNIGMMAEQINKPLYPVDYRQKVYRWIALVMTVAPYLLILLSAFFY